MEEGVAQLAEFLPSMIKKGSGDDVTWAGIIDMTKLNSCSDGIREDLEVASLAAASTVGEIGTSVAAINTGGGFSSSNIKNGASSIMLLAIVSNCF